MLASPWPQTAVVGYLPRRSGTLETTKNASDHLPRVLPRLEFHHGEVLWILAALGFKGAVRDSTFYEYIKSLRKLGIPFPPGEMVPAPRRLAVYSYYHLMELALVLTLRVYHIVPDAVLVEIIRHRRTLYSLYRRAYTERLSGLGRPLLIKIGQVQFRTSGAFLDLRMKFVGGKLSKFGPPRLLSASRAIRFFAAHDITAGESLPIPLSLLAARLVRIARDAPVIRTGPLPKRTS
jgi:hypothetical protein